MDAAQITVEYSPGDNIFFVVAKKGHSCIVVAMEPAEFAEIKKQMNVAWHEHEDAQKPKAATAKKATSK